MFRIVEHIYGERESELRYRSMFYILKLRSTALLKRKKSKNFGSIQVLDRDEFAYAKLLSFFVKVNAMWMLKLICQQFFPVFSQRHRDVMLVKNTLIYMYIMLYFNQEKTHRLLFGFVF